MRDFRSRLEAFVREERFIVAAVRFQAPRLIRRLIKAGHTVRGLARWARVSSTYISGVRKRRYPCSPRVMLMLMKGHDLSNVKEKDNDRQKNN